jgi:glutamate racemase
MKIAFVDSGVGGLFFAIDMISKARTVYNLDGFEFFHVSDYSNVPYGLKSSDKIFILTKNLLDVSLKKGADKIVVACNTACTVLDNSVTSEFKLKGVDLVNIIQHSVEKTFQELSDLKEINLLLLATKRTVQSKKYQEGFLEYGKKIGKKITVIQHYPVEWESEIEANFANNNPNEMAEKELSHIHELMGDAKFQTINSVAMFCTHYPILQSQIKSYFDKHSNNLVKLIAQGGLFFNELKTETGVVNKDSEITINSFDAHNAKIKIPDVVLEYAKKMNCDIKLTY